MNNILYLFSFNKIKKLLILIFFFGVSMGQVFAQTPNFSGTWVLNFEKSQLESRPKGLTSCIFIIKQEGNKFNLTRYHLFGNKKKKLSFKMIADAKTRRIKLFFKGKLAWKDDTLTSSLWNKGFSNVVHYKFGNNPNEFVADEVFEVFNNKSRNHHNIWFFEKK